MSDLSSTPSQGNQNQTLIIVAVVVGVLLCCCCVAVAAGALWFCGDMLTGLSNSCNFQ
jgi:hypothetical protein